MQPKPPAVRDLVLVGGGHSHVQVLKHFAMNPAPGIRLTLISDQDVAPYSGMVPGYIAGQYTVQDIQIPLEPLCRFAGARFICAQVVGLDRENQRVLLGNRPAMFYDLLSLNCGAKPDLKGMPGIPVKPVHEFIQHWPNLHRHICSQGSRVTLGIVGAGAGGVEIALACRASLPASTGITLIGPTLLPGLSRAAAGIVQRILGQNKITYLPNRVCEASPTRSHGTQSPRAQSPRAQSDRTRESQAPDLNRVIHTGLTVGLDNGARMSLDHLLWVTDVRAPGWLQASGLDCDDRGFLRVDASLRSLNDERIFAAGDVAHLQNRQRPKAGVYAVRAASTLSRNLALAIRGLTLTSSSTRFRPQKSFLTIIGTGTPAKPSAIATKGPFALSGKVFWHLKDWIDRRFMARFTRLPQMINPQVSLPEGLAGELPEYDMRCGGCGAKLAADPLRRVLARLPEQRADHVTLGIGDDAALVMHCGGSTLMSVDGFRTMIDDPYCLGRICAHHSLNDLFAMGAKPASALALVTVPLMSQRMMEEELYQLLRGAVDVLSAAGAPLVGGHSAEGAELSMALTVTGTPGPVTLTKGGAYPGDKLLLTKAIGTGVILAGAMRGLYEPGAVAACMKSMDSSNRQALDILQAHGVKALTDITGFGLIGHLGEMLRASGCGVNLALDAVPVLPGALALVGSGLRSSIAPANAQALADYQLDPGLNRNRVALLSDPQTSGGLLACVGPDDADGCTEALATAGINAAVIGEFKEPGHWRIV